MRLAGTVLLAVQITTVVFCGRGYAQNPPDGRIGTVQQELVGGVPTPVEMQLQFGLLTLSNPNGTCSASMLNNFWAITAAHCVYPSTTAPSPQYAASQITLAANWPGYTKSFPALQVISFSPFPFTPNDIALIQMGRHSFDRQAQPDRTLRSLRPMANVRLLSFGRGINQLAAGAGAGATPTVLDGTYRSAQFDISSISPNSDLAPQTYSYPGRNGAVVAGGDSGGPAYIEDWDDPLSTRRKLRWELVGVHSRCQATCLAGQSCPATNPWQWAASVQTCTDAAILPVRDSIMNFIAQPPADDQPTGTFAPVPEEVVRHKRALYAMSLDEPLMAPANAAIDVQLSFEMCHQARFSQGCPLDPSVQLWSYYPSTHQLLHVASGRCVNLSGASQDAGAPIILYPCSGAPNEKWTVISAPARTTWTIKSDLTQQCLTALPGKAPGRQGRMYTLATPGTLAQMPCNGSAAQNFADADAAFAQRNGPR